MTEKGFVARITAHTNKQLFGYKFNWFATNDPRVYVQYVELNPPAKLSEVSVASYLELSIAPLEWTGRPKGGEVNAMAFLLGFRAT